MPLSDLGRRQAESLARRLQELSASERPDLVTPFPRARRPRRSRRRGSTSVCASTIDSTAVALGVAAPEDMVVGLPENLADLVAQADVAVLGPGLIDLDEIAPTLAALEV